MSEDDRAALHALRQWHNGRALTGAQRALDKRASRHTAEAHRKVASFHERATRTLDAVIAQATGSAA